MTTTTRIKKITGRKPAQSLEEKKAHAETPQASIDNQLEHLRDIELWTIFLDSAQSFHAYSISNLLLILSQQDDAFRVVRLCKWQDLNRRVSRKKKASVASVFRPKRRVVRRSPRVTARLLHLGEVDTATRDHPETCSQYSDMGTNAAKSTRKSQVQREKSHLP